MRKNENGFGLIGIVVVIMAVAIIGLAAWLITTKSDNAELKQVNTRVIEQNTAQTDKLKKLEATIETLKNKPSASNEAIDIAKKLVLQSDAPTDELPTMAKVTSPAEMDKQNIFKAKTQLDDRVAFYTKAKRAYLYRPSADKVIEAVNYSLN